MCAMMPMFRQRSSGKVRATADTLVKTGAWAPGDQMNDCLGKNGLSQRDAGVYTGRGTASSLWPCYFSAMDPAARLDAALENARRFFVGEADVQKALRK